MKLSKEHQLSSVHLMEEKQRRSLFPEEWRRVQTCGMNSEVKEWNCSRFKGKELQWDHRGGVMERDSGGIWSKFIKYLWLWAQSWAREEEPDFLKKKTRVIEWHWWSLDEWSCKKTDWNFHFTLRYITFMEFSRYPSPVSLLSHFYPLPAALFFSFSPPVVPVC